MWSAVRTCSPSWPRARSSRRQGGRSRERYERFTCPQHVLNTSPEEWGTENGARRLPERLPDLRGRRGRVDRSRARAGPCPSRGPPSSHPPVVRGVAVPARPFPGALFFFRRSWRSSSDSEIGALLQKGCVPGGAPFPRCAHFLRTLLRALPTRSFASGPMPSPARAFQSPQAPQSSQSSQPSQSSQSSSRAERRPPENRPG